MRRLLEGLMAHGVTLVTTSNFAPGELYRHGLQRNQFLPAIDLIEQNLEVIEVDVAPLTPARVVRVWRNEGDTVRAGDTLVSLTQSTIQADVSARRARSARHPPG